MDWRQFYGGKYVSAKALGKKRVKGKVVSADVDTIKGKDGDENERIVIELNNHDGKFALNKGNCMILSKAYGNDIKKWIGKMVEIYTAPTQFSGEETMGIKVKPIWGKK